MGNKSDLGTVINPSDGSWSERIMQSIPASYTIWKDGTTYRAESNIADGTDYSDTDAATVVQYAIDATTHGKIFFRSGTYTFASGVTIPHTRNIAFEGESFGTYPQTSLGTVFIKDFDDVLMTFSGDAVNYLTPFTIRNVGMNGCPAGGVWTANCHTGDMIVVNYRRFFLIENVRVYRNGGNGIHISNSGVWRLANTEVSEYKNGAGIRLDTCADWQIYNPEVNVGYATTTNTEHGLVVSANSGGQVIGGHFEGFTGITSESQLLVTGTYIPWSYQDGIYCPSTSNMFIGNTIVNGNQSEGANYSGIRAGRQSMYIGNYISGTKFKYGIYDYGNGCLLGNAIEYCVTANVYSPNSDTYPSANIGNFGYPTIQRTQHHIADDTLTNQESTSVFTNLGAGGTITLTLPQTAVAGMTFEFVVMAAQALRIDPGAAGGIYINGAKQTDDKYIWADDEGESVKLMADGNGDWVALYTQGTWTVE